MADHWRRGGDLLIDSHVAYRFMRGYYDGEVRSNGNLPWIVDVLKTNEPYQMTTPRRPRRIFVASLNKIRSAFTKWLDCQNIILQKEVDLAFREATMIQDIIKEATVSHPQEARGYVSFHVCMVFTCVCFKSVS